MHAAETPKPSTGDSGYRVIAHFQPKGSEYIEDVAVDAVARRLYMTRGDAIDVLNADSGKQIGEISTKSGTNGLVIVPALKWGFATNSTANTITIFNTEDLKVLHVVPSGGEQPEDVVYDEGADHVYVANSGSGSVAVLDAASGKVLTTIKVGGRLRQMAASGYGRLYIAAEDKNVVHVVDTNTMKFLGDFPIGTGEKPYGLSLDPVGRRLFVACEDGTLAVIDTDIGFTFEQLPIGSGASGSTFTFKPSGAGGWKGADFIATADGKLNFIKMNAFISYSSVGSLMLQPGIHAVAFDPPTHHLFVPAGREILVVGQ